MVAPGGEALGGVVGAFRHMIQTEGFFSLYKARLAFREMVCWCESCGYITFCLDHSLT